MREDVNNENEGQLSEPLLSTKGNDVRSPSSVLSDCVLFVNDAKFDVNLFLLKPIVFQLVSRFMSVDEIHLFLMMCSSNQRRGLRSAFKSFPGSQHWNIQTWFGARKQRQGDFNNTRRHQLLRYGFNCWVGCLIVVTFSSMIFVVKDDHLSLLTTLGVMAATSGCVFFVGGYVVSKLVECADAMIEKVNDSGDARPEDWVGRPPEKGVFLQLTV